MYGQMHPCLIFWESLLTSYVTIESFGSPLFQQNTIKVFQSCTTVLFLSCPNTQFSAIFSKSKYFTIAVYKSDL